MDYSLLVGIHDLARGNSENIRGTTLSVYQPRVPFHRSLSKKGKDVHFDRTPPKRLATNLPSEEFLERKLSFFTSEDGGLFATNSHDEPTGDYIYYFGVIDLLTTYGLKKHLETFFKGLSFPKSGLSAVPPDKYADRFVKFIRAIVKPKDDLTLDTRKGTSLSPIPEESPVRTPLAESFPKLPTTDTVNLRTVAGPPAPPEQKLPMITIQYPSPDIRDEVFESEMMIGGKQPLVNGWHDDYTQEEKQKQNDEEEDGVQL